MQSLKMLAGSAAIAALVSLPSSSASADWYYRHHDECFFLALPFCVAGAVVGTAAMVAATPFVVAGDVLAPRPWPGYYRRPPPYYARPWAYYGGPRPGYYRPPAYYYGPPAGYPARYDMPPPNPGYYGPPRGYGGPPPGY